MPPKKIILIVASTIFIGIYSVALVKIGVYLGSAKSNQTYDAAVEERYIVKEYNNMIAVDRKSVV